MVKINSVHDYPFDIKPETWPLNDVFLNAIGRMQKKFAQQYNSFQWGLEIEFGIELPIKMNDEEYEAMIIESPYSQPSMDLHRKLYGRDKDNSTSQRLANKIIKYINTTKQLKDYSDTVGEKKRSMVKQMREYQNALLSDDPKTVSHAKYNIYLAHLHVMPTQSGGLRQIIQPRFGSYGYGIGWWDDVNTAEIRLPPTNGPRKFIRDYHRMMKIVYETAELHGVVPIMDVGTGQLHFSFWSPWDGNETAMKNDCTQVGGQYMLHGIYALVAEAPHLVNDYDPQEYAYSIDLDVSDRKGHAIRQNGTSWELRRPYKSNFMHLARDIAVIMGGVHYGFEVGSLKPLKDQRDTGIKEKTGLAVKDTLRRPFFKPIQALLERCTPEIEWEYWHRLEDVRKKINSGELTLDTIEVPAHWKDKEDAFREGLEATLQLKQNLYLHPNDILDLMSALETEIGEENTNLFKYEYEEGKFVDLGKTAGWHYLLQSIDVDFETGLLNVDHLPEELRVHFESYAVDGQRLYLEGQTFPTHYGAYTLDRTVDRMASAKSVNTIFEPEEVKRVTSFYNDITQDRLSSMASQLINKAERLISHCQDNDVEMTPIMLRSLFSHVAEAVALEEKDANRVVDSDKTQTLANADSEESLKERSNTLKQLRPHYRQMAEDLIDKKRTQGHLSNQWVSSVWDTVDYLEKDVLSLNHRAYAMMQAMAISIPSAIIKGVDAEVIRENLRDFVLGDFPVELRLAMSEEHYNRDDMLSMVDSVRDQFYEQLEVLKDGEAQGYISAIGDVDSMDRELVLSAGKKSYKLLSDIIPEIHQGLIDLVMAIPEKRQEKHPALKT